MYERTDSDAPGLEVGAAAADRAGVGAEVAGAGAGAEVELRDRGAAAEDSG